MFLAIRRVHPSQIFLMSQHPPAELLCCASPVSMLSMSSCDPESARVEPAMAMAQVDGGGTDGAEQPPVGHVSPRKPKRSPQKARKRPPSPDPSGQPNGENYAYGDPRVEPLSQLSDIIAMGETGADNRCASDSPYMLCSVGSRAGLASDKALSLCRQLAPCVLRFPLHSGN